MAQVLRVGINLPPRQVDGIARYLGRQPLLPTWELSVVNCADAAVQHDRVNLIVTSPQLFERPEPRAMLPAVFVVEQLSQDDVAALAGIPSLRGVVVAGDPPETLALGIAAAASHGVWLAQSVWDHFGQGPTHELGETLEALTLAETETLTLVARGMTNAEIARARYVRPSTVKYHVDNLRLKTGAGSRVELVIVAHRLLELRHRRNPP